jgi:hypothetical protein
VGGAATRGLSRSLDPSSHNPVIDIGDVRENLIRSPVSVRQRGRMHDIVARTRQVRCESNRQLCVDQKPHAAPSRTTLLTAEARAPYSSAA